MSAMLNRESIDQLKQFINLCTIRPTILHLPELAFFKKFIENFGGKVPEEKLDSSPQEKWESKVEPEDSIPFASESDESDIEFDMTGVIEADTDAPQKMGNLTLQPTEEEIAESQTKRSEAVSAYAEQNYAKSIELYTEAIVLNPHAALLYAKRGQVYLNLTKPNACIRDCNRALELNPDSAAAHKFRGRAYQMLGKWEEAASDLRLACKYDFDEQANEWLRQVTPNAQKIEDHNRKKMRKKEEKLEKEKRERLRKATEAAKTREENTRPSQTETNSSGPGTGAGFYKFLNDPEVWEDLQDPEVAKAVNDIASNPLNLMKYQNNPKIMALINKTAAKYGGAEGLGESYANMMGAMGGGMPGFPGDGINPSKPPKPPKTEDDVGLD